MRGSPSWRIGGLLAVTAVTAAADPHLLFPPNGRYVPIVITGAVTQVIVYNLPRYETTHPTPRQQATIDHAIALQPDPNTLISVSDQYRQDEPSVTDVCAPGDRHPALLQSLDPRESAGRLGPDPQLLLHAHDLSEGQARALLGRAAVLDRRLRRRLVRRGLLERLRLRPSTRHRSCPPLIANPD